MLCCSALSPSPKQIALLKVKQREEGMTHSSDRANWGWRLVLTPGPLLLSRLEENAEYVRPGEAEQRTHASYFHKGNSK